jgi:hypothetical protein
MGEELDKRWNRESDFKYPAIDAKSHVRLLRFSHRERPPCLACYELEIVALADLSQTQYKALSYTWGHAHTTDDIQEIEVGGQPIFIRRNLFDFLNTATAKCEYGLFFVDAICINQLDYSERQAQVQEMDHIYRNANEVIAWLGLPDQSQLENVRALNQTKGIDCKNCVSWTTAQWAGFNYLSYHGYWNRVWIIQEVLLATSLTIWCGFFAFSPTLFEAALYPLSSPRARIADNGRPVAIVGGLSRLRTPAEITVTHRLRHVLRPVKDTLAQGTKIGTWEEMKMDLMKPSTVTETYQSQIPDLIYQIVRKFSKLECSDPRDRLYGLLGIIHPRSRARVKPDYTREVSHTYYQALKVGYQELYHERGVLAFSHSGFMDDEYLGYYCDVRDSFGIADGESLSILREVLGELQFQIRLKATVLDVQWQQQFEWRDAEIATAPDFKQLLKYADLEQHEEREGPLFKFHKRQHRLAKNL